MSVHRAVLATLLVAGALAAVGSAGAAGGPAVAGAQTQNNSTNTSLGADISSFMQSSAAEISGAVETGMWSARFNATSNDSERRRLVDRRTDDLRAELNALQERRDELVAAREAGNISEAAYKAQIGQLVGRINALRSAINATEPKARQVNASVGAVESLEADAAELSGPAIAAVARNSSGVDTPKGLGNDDGERGPPANAADGNGQQGPPTDAGNASTANGSDSRGNNANAAGDPPRKALGDGNGNADAPGGADAPVEGQGQNQSERGPSGERSTDERPVNRTDVDGARGAADDPRSGPRA